jgi:environmental stress-induced protein Ves
MRILRAGDHRQMPWKNGGGFTTEIAISPSGAAVSDFDWRISIAKVPSSGPFSAFANIDRVLAVLDGEMRLTIGGGKAALIGPASPAIAFPGDVPTSADVIREVTDLNVMVRRGRFSASVRRFDQADITASADETFVLFRSNALASNREQFGLDDLIHLSPSEAIAFAGTPQTAWLIEIQRL